MISCRKNAINFDLRKLDEEKGDENCVFYEMGKMVMNLGALCGKAINFIR